MAASNLTKSDPDIPYLKSDQDIKSSQILKKKTAINSNSKMLTLTSKLKELLYDTHLCY